MRREHEYFFKCLYNSKTHLVLMAVEVLVAEVDMLVEEVAVLVAEVRDFVLQQEKMDSPLLQHMVMGFLMEEEILQLFSEKCRNKDTIHYIRHNIYIHSCPKLCLHA